MGRAPFVSSGAFGTRATLKGFEFFFKINLINCGIILWNPNNLKRVWIFLKSIKFIVFLFFGTRATSKGFELNF